MNMFYGVHHCNFASAPTCQSKSFNTNSQLNSHIEHLIYDSGAPGNLDLKREKDSEIQRRILICSMFSQCSSYLITNFEVLSFSQRKVTCTLQIKFDTSRVIHWACYHLSVIWKVMGHSKPGNIHFEINFAAYIFFLSNCSLMLWDILC